MIASRPVKLLPVLGLVTVVALLTLVATVITINEVIWKPLYRRAVTQYRYD